ncbi:bifunctional adenosylcobinamide kinase/adenosylcobinamide-phosphate guanylyltransferase [Brevibacillus migulae]|uniref:bifunctional adenosylcobinamide kinase/adenosylcobinamide-phosphate guanylyltransferase n=1 Tax=Brevibacillus migulae TaxID=1644114 RepID=UPI00106EFEAF|nr:bifunctional adenosylcobinamide kinase/adenosylcobinamide-phosphate guanylyltransferase [Brevibacillus migulae]
MKLILVTGGVRSGKSRFAEELVAAETESVLYVATGQAWDDESANRIREHRLRRPAHWGLLEIKDSLAEIMQIAGDNQGVLLDCLSGWISRKLMELPEEKLRDEEISRQLHHEIGQLLENARTFHGTMVIVTNEVGLGGVALTPLGRWFADVLGEANQQMARHADEVYAVMAGIPWRLKG